MEYSFPDKCEIITGCSGEEYFFAMKNKEQDFVQAGEMKHCDAV